MTDRDSKKERTYKQFRFVLLLAWLEEWKMKIDMFGLWFGAFMVCLITQNHFTFKKVSWNVSYTYTTDSMDYIAYGQQSIISENSDLDWSSVRKFLGEDIMYNNNNDEQVHVVILAANKFDCNRFWRPFWKAS